MDHQGYPFPFGQQTRGERAGRKGASPHGLHATLRAVRGLKDAAIHQDW